MLNNVVQIVLIVSTIFLSILAIELKDILYAVMCLFGMCVTTGALFWLLYAPYVAVFQLLVYSGAVIVLFIAAVMLTTRKENLSDEIE